MPQKYIAVFAPYCSKWADGVVDTRSRLDLKARLSHMVCQTELCLVDMSSAVQRIGGAQLYARDFAFSQWFRGISETGSSTIEHDACG